MAHDRQWLIDTLRRLGYTEEADEAALELPDQLSTEQLIQFADKHGISRDEVESRMGGSP
jgi:hypothetical protein